MQVGSSPLNTVPVNSGGSVEPQGPAPVVAAEAYDWLVQVIIGGTDRTSDLMDVPSIDRERGGAGLADFNLLIPEGAFHHEQWRGQPVYINYISERDGVVSVRRRFTGWVVSPVWNSARRTLLCKCSDRLQKRIDALSIEAINGLAPAYWSADVYSDAAGRSRWEYLQERLETVVASVNSDALGNLVYSTWYAGPVEFEFGHGTTLAGSVEIESAELNSLTNKVEIEADWRFPRLRQKNVGYGWSHPDTGGFSGMQGFCSWYNDTSELPDVDMILSACESSGQTVISAGFQRLPLTMADPCGNGGAWINEYPDLVLSAYVTAARRWVQTITENYRLTLVASASVEANGEVVERDRVAVEVESDRAEAWDSNDFGRRAGNAIEVHDDDSGGQTGHSDDLRDEPRRLSAVRCILNLWRSKIIKAHTQTIVRWQVPTSAVMDIDLGQTLYLNDQRVRAVGRCCRIEDAFDLVGGTAITTLSIAVMRGGGSTNDPMEPPAYPVESPPGPPGVAPSGALPTQLGGRSSSPEYDDEKDGFSGNYSMSEFPGQFPRRFSVTAPEIPAAVRDEKKIEIGQVYRIAIPNDLLEV
ncbi:hypothetical protein V0R48_18460 [Pseudomonas alcaligenes]|jgi:hypothetical protein|uniref:hypothetical protein n=1 Tax=Aquipseudomonas alcaligenes TaxID=43263 RepID=UPI002E7B13C0|nr:hypothetical protein [Pseudomonas alcaligenes]MEE1950967.1 hypothetical protein [Pseudomonas alcaligenes]